MVHHGVSAPSIRSFDLHQVANRVIPALLRTPLLHRLVSGNLMLVTFTGRMSGRRFTTPVTYVTTTEGVAFFSNARWWVNLRGGAPVTLQLRGRTVDGMAAPVEEGAIVAREAGVYMARHGVRAAGRIGLNMPPAGMPDERALAWATRDHVVVYVTIPEASR